MHKYPTGTDCVSMQNDIDELQEQLDALQENMYIMSCIVGQAVSDIKSIAQGYPQEYANTLKNALTRNSVDRRPMTMKDAKRIADHAERELRKVWEFLDPSGKDVSK